MRHLWENLPLTLETEETWSDSHSKSQNVSVLCGKSACPYDLVGCKFSHSDEPVDGQDGDVEDIHIDEATDGEECDAEDDFTLNENQCHLCKKQLSTKDELWDHVEKVHVEYFQGMLEYAAENRS